MFLTEPAVQAYIDPTYGNLGATGATIGPDRTKIVGQSNASGGVLSRFDFGTGTFISSQVMTDLSISLGYQQSLARDESGNIWTNKDNSDNAVGLARVNPNTTPWTVDATWGTGGGSFNPPNNVPLFVSQAYLKTGNAQWLVQGMLPASSIGVTVSRAEPGSVGFWGHAYAVTGAVSACAGPQTPSLATAYWTCQPFSIYGSAYSLGKTIINVSAVLYDPATWPTPNPDIFSSTIASYAPTDFDAAWSAIVDFTGPAYDQRDGNVIVQVQGSGGGNAQYIVKLDTTTGAVMWKVPVASAGGFHDQLVCLSTIANGIYLYYAQTGTFAGTVYVIDTGDGSVTTQAVTGLQAIDNQTSDDQFGCIVGNVGWDAGQGSILLLGTTPSTGSTLGAVYFIQKENQVKALSAISYARTWGRW